MGHLTWKCREACSDETFITDLKPQMSCFGLVFSFSCFSRCSWTWLLYWACQLYVGMCVCLCHISADLGWPKTTLCMFKVYFFSLYYSLTHESVTSLHRQNICRPLVLCPNCFYAPQNMNFLLRCLDPHGFQGDLLFSDRPSESFIWALTGDKNGLWGLKLWKQRSSRLNMSHLSNTWLKVCLNLPPRVLCQH